MNLPVDLKNALHNELEHSKTKGLAKANEDLSTRYRSKDQRKEIASKGEQYMRQGGHRSAYIASRMPATFAANVRVLEELKRNMPEANFSTLLDIGSGPGTTMWAALSIFENLEEINLIEQDENLIKIGKRLAEQGDSPYLKKANWHHENILLDSKLAKHDLVTISYALNELPEEHLEKLVNKLWESTNQALMIIEPGTTAGFDRIKKVRKQLIERGAHLLAPCPHSKECPLSQNDWCHFSQRVERTSLHRQIKGGSLGYEDEKFSYLIFSRQPGTDQKRGRILRHPQKHSGHISLTLCSQEGVHNRIISKKEGPTYKEAKKADWGDLL